MDRDDLTPEEIEALAGPAPPSANRPDRLAADEAKVLQAACDRAAGRFSAALSGLLRRPVEVRFIGIGERNYSRFVSTRKPTSCCCVASTASAGSEAESAPRNDDGSDSSNSNPHNADAADRVVLDIAGTILSPMIARLLGGDPSRHAPVRRRLTDIDRRLARRIVAVLLDELGAAWSAPVDQRWQLVEIESNPLRASVFPAGQAVVVAQFELALGELRGPVELCIPVSLAQRLVEQLAAVAPKDDGAGPAASAGEISRALENSLVELRVELARTTATAGDVLNLAVGDVITTDQPVDRPLIVELDGQTRLAARIGAHEGQKAIQVEKRIDP
ncbi:MAG: FliM/FliN family flagellar motor switch protein [Pirellulales bacterium]|nr:FliM/FliN family flagellar motor switch protein [Pirellulales bacterium]